MLRGLGRLGDQCTIDATGARICQPGATTAATPTSAPCTPATPAQYATKQVCRPATPRFAPPTFCPSGHGCYSFVGYDGGVDVYLRGSPWSPAWATTSGGIPASQTGGQYPRAAYIKRQKCTSQQVLAKAAQPGNCPAPPPAGTPLVAQSSTGQPIQVGQCQGGSNPGSACLSTQDCSGGGICNTGAIAAAPYAYAGPSAFSPSSYVSPIPGSSPYAALPATSSLPTWAWVAMAAGAAYLLPKVL